MLRILVSWCLMFVVFGCVDGEPTESSQQAPLMNCQGGDCPTNSPVISTYSFHELSMLPSVSNQEGVTIQSFLINHVAHELVVKNGRLYGRLGNVTLSGAQLVGAQLWLRAAGLQFVVRISGVRSVPMWANRVPAQAPPKIEAYLLEWTPTSGAPPGPEAQWRNLCADAQLPSDAPDLRGVPSYLSFVFEGERINTTTKQIYGYDPTWFNIGCAGHLLMKMVLMGHVEAARALGYVTTMDQRRTIMKMFAADYCGTGYAFTVPGIALQWQDDRQWVRYSAPLANLKMEARWTPTGAACLNLPRVTANPTASSLAAWPLGVEREIDARCAIRSVPCSSDVQVFEGAHLVTANPRF
jgi:ADYC domain